MSHTTEFTNARAKNILRWEPAPHRHDFTTQNDPGEIPNTYTFRSVPGGCDWALEPIRGVVGLGQSCTKLTLIGQPASHATSASEQASRHGHLCLNAL
jgi:hypothetical protein